MIEVQIRYKTQQITLNVPDEFQELSKSQFNWFCKLQREKEDAAIDYRKYLKKIFGIPELFTSHISTIECIKVFNSIGLLEKDVLAARSFYPQGLIWRSPKMGMANLSFYQFTLADEAYINCLTEETNTKKMRSRIFAALYTPFGMKWSTRTAAIATKIFYLLPRSTSRKIIAAYGAQAQWIRATYPESFSGSKSSGRSFGYRGMLVSISGAKFGPVDKAKEQNVHDVLTDIEQTILNSLKQE
jgi:hypothetical protein